LTLGGALRYIKALKMEKGEKYLKQMSDIKEKIYIVCKLKKEPKRSENLKPTFLKKFQEWSFFQIEVQVIEDLKTFLVAK
jgi:hypothetical protein